MLLLVIYRTNTQQTIIILFTTIPKYISRVDDAENEQTVPCVGDSAIRLAPL